MSSFTPRIFAAGAAHCVRTGQAAGGSLPQAPDIGRVTTTIGGSAYVAAFALRQSEAAVALYSGRGGDADGARVADALLLAGIDDLALTWLDRASPGVLAIRDGAGALVAEIADPGPADLLSGRTFSRRHLRAVMAECDAAIFDASLPATGIAYLLKTFRGRPVFAIGASAGRVVRLGPHLAELSALFLSQAEAAALFDVPAESDLRDLASKLAEGGAQRAAVIGGGEVAVLDAGQVFVQVSPDGRHRPEDLRDRLAGTATHARLGGADFVDAVRLGLATALVK